MNKRKEKNPKLILSLFSRILCFIGVHRPLLNHFHIYMDKTTTFNLYIAECCCGKKWYVDSAKKYLGTKIYFEDE